MRNEQLTHQLLAKIVDADLTPAQLAGELHLELEQLSQWILHPENLRIVEGLSRLADVRAQMILSKYRATAAAHLIAIAADKEASELSRKACVDLLTTNLEVFLENEQQMSSARASGPHSPAPSEETILAALERLGREADHGDDIEIACEPPVFTPAPSPTSPPVTSAPAD